jgi:hypothetical protein
MGVSPDHSSTVGLILNHRTGFVSPQYHVVYDDLFSSVPNAETGGLIEAPTQDSEFWRNIISTGYESLVNEEEDDDAVPQEISNDWLTDEERRFR